MRPSGRLPGVVKRLVSFACHEMSRDRPLVAIKESHGQDWDPACRAGLSGPRHGALLPSAVACRPHSGGQGGGLRSSLLPRPRLPEPLGTCARQRSLGAGGGRAGSDSCSLCSTSRCGVSFPSPSTGIVAFPQCGREGLTLQHAVWSGQLSPSLMTQAELRST